MLKWLKRQFVPHKHNDHKPDFLRERDIFALILVVIMFFGFSFYIHFFTNKHSDFLAAVVASVLIDLTNTNRQNYSLEPLRVSETLTEAAQMKANDMAEKGYFSHTSP